MEFEDDNLDGDFLKDLMTADNDASFLSEEARLDEHQTKKNTSSKNLFVPLESVLQELPENIATTAFSAIHTGDTDSSDDDDNRNQLDSNLNSYGKSIKSLLPQENREVNTFPTEKSESWKSKTHRVPHKNSYTVLPTSRSASDDFLDPVFHIRISERLISTTTLQESMVGRTAVSMDRLKCFTDGGEKDTDWVIAGTIVFKSPVKTSQKGAQYSIWRLSDLRPGLKTASVFLFRSAFKDLWKTSVGTVVGILNPSIIDNRDGSGDEAALSVDLAQKVMILGKSKDYGLCKSTKKNGERCGVFVNKSACAVCIYHVQTEYRKCSRRSELQSTAPRTPTMRNKVLGKSEVFYGGKSFTSVPTGRNRNHVAKDKGTLQRLNGFKSQMTLKMPFSSQVKKPSCAKINVELVECEKSLTSGTKTVDMNTKTQKIDLTKQLLKSVAPNAGLLNSEASSVSVNTNTTPEQCTFLLAESIEDDKELVQKTVPKMSFDQTKTTQRIAGTASKEITHEEKKKNLFGTKEIECSSEYLTVVKKQKTSPKESETKKRSLPRSMTSVSCKVAKSDVEPSFLGLASRLGLGLNNKAPPLTQSVKPSLPPQESFKPPVKAMSRGEMNLKMINRSITIAEPKKTSCSPELASNLNMLNKKRNAEFEKKQQVEAEMSRSAKETKPKLKLESSSDKPASALIKSPLMAPKSNVLVNPKVDFGLLQNVPNKSSGSRAGGSSPRAPCLMSGNGFIDLNDPIPSNRRVSAKMNAMKYAKSRGGFMKIDPNSTTCVVSAAAKRKREPSPDTSEEQSRAEDKAVQIKFKELMETKSRHSGLLEAHDDKEKEAYFNKLEKKEQLEEKMMTTFEVKCKAVTCLECNYTSFSAAEICKADGHALKTRDAVKRFFKCADCGYRTVVLTRIPKSSCNKCRSSHWQRAAMMKERLSETVVLSIRGAEEKYFGSHSGGNINLLVPMS